MKRGNPANRLYNAMQVLSSEHLPEKFNRSMYQRAYRLETGKQITDGAALKHIYALCDAGLVCLCQQGGGNAQNVYCEAKTR